MPGERSGLRLLRAIMEADLLRRDVNCVTDDANLFAALRFATGPPDEEDDRLWLVSQRAQKRIRGEFVYFPTPRSQEIPTMDNGWNGTIRPKKGWVRCESLIPPELVDTAMTGVSPTLTNLLWLVLHQVTACRVDAKLRETAKSMAGQLDQRDKQFLAMLATIPPTTKAGVRAVMTSAII